MSSEIVLKVENVGKRYAMILLEKLRVIMAVQVAINKNENKDLGEIYEAPHHRLFQTLWHGRRQFYKEFSPSLNFSFIEGDLGSPNFRCSEIDKNWDWALKDVSFEVKKGECLGIIGRNGSAMILLKKLTGNHDSPRFQ